MSLSFLSPFPNEKVSLSMVPVLYTMVLGAVEFLLLHLIFYRDRRTCACPSRSDRSSNIESELGSFDHSIAELSNPLPRTSKETEDGNYQSREDVETVMERLGISCHPGDDEKPHEEYCLSSDDLLNLFEEKEPSLEEVKAAFDVFDENRDGFIDAEELQRVLRILGFKEGLEVEKCRRMIGVFDENGDGRIDFREFLKFMENAFC